MNVRSNWISRAYLNYFLCRPKVEADFESRPTGQQHFSTQFRFISTDPIWSKIYLKTSAETDYCRLALITDLSARFFINRNVVTAAALFRQAGRRAAQRRVSQYSSTDEGDLASNSDGDGLSRTSVDSAQEGHHQGVAGGAPIVYRNSTVTSTCSKSFFYFFLELRLIMSLNQIR